MTIPLVDLYRSFSRLRAREIEFLRWHRCYVITTKGSFLIASVSRVSLRSWCTRYELLYASDALRLDSSISASPPSACRLSGGGGGGQKRLKVHARCIFSPRFYSIDVDPVRVEGHRARRPQLSRQFVPNTGRLFFPPKDGYTVA